MTETRREHWRAQIKARLDAMACVRASAPARDAYAFGWVPNEDGTITLWQVGPGPALAESVTLRVGVEPADFEQLQLLQNI